MNGQNCSVLRTDVVGFGSPDRTDEDRRIIRRVQHEILERSFEAAGIAANTRISEGRGDGDLIVIRPDVSTELLVHPFIDSLVTGLSRHNADAGAGSSFQLRVALDVGPVRSDAQGVTGEVIIRVSRLVDAPTLKENVTQTHACLGFIASTFVFDSVIRQRPGHVDPGAYKMVDFWSKGSMVTGWMYLDGGTGTGTGTGTGNGNGNGNGTSVR